MVSYQCNSNSPFWSGYFNTIDPFSRSLGDFDGFSAPGGGLTVSQALVLDSEKGELVKETARVGKKEVNEAKVLAALKSHSEAERRRRERINAHLATLRGLVPCTEKMDKATLLAEVIRQVKELKKHAAEASKGLLVPMDDDELTVEPYDGGAADEALSFKASLCCNFQPELLSDIRQAIDALQLKIVNAEISTLGGRLKNVLILSSCRNKNVVTNEEANQLTNSIHQALSSVLEKGSAASPEYSPRTTLPNKRRRIYFFDSSSSSS